MSDCQFFLCKQTIAYCSCSLSPSQGCSLMLLAPFSLRWSWERHSLRDAANLRHLNCIKRALPPHMYTV